MQCTQKFLFFDIYKLRGPFGKFISWKSFQKLQLALVLTLQFQHWHNSVEYLNFSALWLCGCGPCCRGTNKKIYVKNTHC
ncbi:unnamed protein product, partial [Iphiclides podalirius]